MSDILKIENVSKLFRDDRGVRSYALENVSLTVHEGEFLVLLGPSGCGKSTLLRLATHLEAVSSGTIAVREDISRSRMSFVFQQFALLPWLTVYENAELGLLRTGLSPHDREVRVHKELKELGLLVAKQAYPRELSGGMRQRVGLARALVTEPAIIFLDEPFSEVDTFTAEELRRELLRIWRERKTTIVMVSHNIPEAIELADRIVVFSPRPGTIKEIVHNPLARPRNPRSSAFFELEDRLRAHLAPKRI